MSEIEQLLQRWEQALCRNVDLRGLVARNPLAYKWKAAYRSCVLRESVSWRTHDLLVQAQTLFSRGHVLGSRILLRSALESLAILVYLNGMIDQMLKGDLGFHEFSAKTSRLLLGSRNETTKHTSINIVTVIEQCDKKYPGISDVFATLSESAHPNYEGVCFGYSRVDHERHETNFANHRKVMWADRHESLLRFIAAVFEHEYDDVWRSRQEALETWLVENDLQLEEAKSKGA